MGSVIPISVIYWDRVTHICVGNLNIIGSNNGLSPGRRQAIIWTNAGILLIRPLGTNIQWNLDRNSYIFIQEKAFKTSSGKRRPFCPGRNVFLIRIIDLHNRWSSVVTFCLFWHNLAMYRPVSNWTQTEPAYDDVIKWKHFPRCWPFVRGIHRSPVNSLTKASDAELWCFLRSAAE